MNETPPPAEDDRTRGGHKMTVVGDVPVAVTDVGAAAKFLMDRGPRGGGLLAGWAVRLIGAKEVALAAHDTAYRSLLAGPGINFPDGLPVVWATRLRLAGTGESAQRIRGATLFRTTLDEGRTVDLRHFFLGTTPNTLAKLIESTESAYPGLRIVGSWAPPFAPIDDAFYGQAVDTITSTRAEVVWVGLGAPKQDDAVVGLASRVDATFVAVGAAFDFLAGTAREAPVWMQNSGLEWLFRFACDPRRLWRRYLVGNAQFLSVIARHEFRRVVANRRLAKQSNVDR